MRGFVLLLALVTALPAFAAEKDILPPSLFFTKDETQKIGELAAKTKPAHVHQPGIYLGAVMYYSQDDWALWLQGQRWTPASDRADLHVIDVSPNEVRLRWASAPNAATKEIVLHPYQTYEIATGRIVEGAP